jgi:hypothetical protein
MQITGRNGIFCCLLTLSISRLHSAGGGMIIEYGLVGGMRIRRRNRSTRRKRAPVVLCPPQNPHYLTWDPTRAAAVGSQRLTGWAMATALQVELGWHPAEESIQNSKLKARLTSWIREWIAYRSVPNKHKVKISTTKIRLCECAAMTFKNTKFVNNNIVKWVSEFK